MFLILSIVILKTDLYGRIFLDKFYQWDERLREFLFLTLRNEGFPPKARFHSPSIED